MRYDYNDCLRTEYTIPGLIACLLDANNITAEKLSYGFQSVKKGKTNGARIDEICGALNYPSDRVPKSFESVCKVHAASTGTFATPVDFEFEVLDPSFFQSNDGRLTSGQINRASLRSWLTTESSIQPLSYNQGSGSAPLQY